MKITQKHIQYILLLLIVAIAFSAYYFGYLGFIDKADKMKQSNQVIENRVFELAEKESHRADWTSAIASADSDIKSILAKYGPGNTPEKSIMFVRELEKETGANIPSISFGEDSVLFASDELDENGMPKVEMSGTSLTVNYSATYDGLKKLIDYINNYKERMNVSGFNASYNQENGQLAGTMLINLFSVKDENHEYYDPSVYGVDIGIENIFGTATPAETNDVPVNTQPETTDNEGEGEGEGETGETTETGETAGETPDNTGE